MNPDPPDRVDAPTSRAGAERLPCGRDPLDVWDHAAAGRRPTHEQTCPYCQGVIAEYEVLVEPTRAWKVAEVDPPTALLERVMAIVRSSLRARTYLPLASPYGPVQLDAATAAAVLRWAVDQVEGARARSCRIDPRAAGDAVSVSDVAFDGPLVDIDLTMTGRSGVRLQPLADDVRRVVVAVSGELLGLRAMTVDIEILDLFDADPGPGPAPDRVR
jgi:hypothetical protein